MSFFGTLFIIFDILKVPFVADFSNFSISVGVAFLTKRLLKTSFICSLAVLLLVEVVLTSFKTFLILPPFLLKIEFISSIFSLFGQNSLRIYILNFIFLAYLNKLYPIQNYILLIIISFTICFFSIYLVDKLIKFYFFKKDYKKSRLRKIFHHHFYFCFH